MIATSFHLPPSRSVQKLEKRKRLPSLSTFPPTESKTRDFALQTLPNNQNTGLLFQKLDPTGVHGTYLFILTYIAATIAIQNLLHNPDAGDINIIVLKAASVFLIATSLVVYDAWYIFIGVLIGNGFFDKVYFLGLMVLMLMLTLLCVASPVIVTTAKLEGFRFIWTRLSAYWNKKQSY